MVGKTHKLLLGLDGLNDFEGRGILDLWQNPDLAKAQRVVFQRKIVCIQYKKPFK